MELSTSSISNEIDKSIKEEFSVSQAAIDEIKRRREKGQKPKAISNEEIKKNDPILETYKVLDDAIHGGMGSVWRVHHESWNVDLAMKRPQPRFFAEGSEARKEEFIRECENWINLGLHPNIVSCYYVREIGGVPTIFSEWMDNGSLKDRIRDGSLYEGTEEEVQERILDIAIQTARGLQYSHENNLIHQDVKPGNILLTKDWDAKVADFGLAKAQSQLTENKKPVSTGYTIQYCPREQAEGAPAEKWMDVYAWALTVLEMYAGKRLWDTGAEAKEHCEEYFSQCRTLSSGMKELLDSCLAGEINVFSRLEILLKKEYRKICGKDYPKPVPKAASATADILNNRALSFLDLGRNREAEQLWEEALLTDIYHSQSFYNLNLYRWRRETFKDEYERRDKEFLLRDRLKTIRENGRIQTDELTDSVITELNGGKCAPWQLSVVQRIETILSREKEWRELCSGMRRLMDKQEISAAIEQLDKMREIPEYAFGEEYQRFAVELSKYCIKKALRGVRRSVIYFPQKVNDADISEDGVVITCTNKGAQMYDAYKGAATCRSFQSGNAETWANRTVDILANADSNGSFYTMSHMDSRRKREGEDQDLIRRWNSRTGKCAKKYKASASSELRLFQVSEDGTRIVGFDGRAHRIFAWNSDLGKYIRKWEVWSDPAFKKLNCSCFETVDIGADDRSVLCGLEKYESFYSEGPGAAIIWDIEGERELKVLPVRDRSICCKLSRDMRYALISPRPMASTEEAYIPKGILVVDLIEGGEIRRICCDDLSAAGLACSQTGRFLFASMGETGSRHLGANLYTPRPAPEKWHLILFDFAGGEPLAAFDAPRIEKLKLFGEENYVFGYTSVCAYVWFLDWELSHGDSGEESDDLRDV